MAGQFALGAEIFLRLDDPRAEELGPVAIDRHAGRERIGPIDEPLRQREPVHRSTRGQRMKRPGHGPGVTTSPGSRKFPLRRTFVTRCFSFGNSTITGKRRDLWPLLFQPGDLVADRLQFRGDGPEVGCELIRLAPWFAA